MYVCSKKDKIQAQYFLYGAAVICSVLLLAAFFCSKCSDYYKLYYV